MAVIGVNDNFDNQFTDAQGNPLPDFTGTPVFSLNQNLAEVRLNGKFAPTPTSLAGLEWFLRLEASDETLIRAWIPNVADPGGPMDPLSFTKEWTIDDTLPTSTWIDAVDADDDTGADTATDADGQPGIPIAVYTDPDLDTDSNNDGTIDPDNSSLATDDPIEEGQDADGDGKDDAVAVIGVNDNFDNQFIDAQGNPLPDFTGTPIFSLDQELAEIQLGEQIAPTPTALTGLEWFLRLEASDESLIRAWIPDDLDPGGSMQPLSFTREWTSHDNLPTSIWVDFLAPGVVDLAWVLYQREGSTQTERRRDPVRLNGVNVDIDTDSDNHDNDDEDVVEETAPGKVIPLNDNDDNDNGTPDWSDGGQLLDAKGDPVVDGELREARLSYNAPGIDLSGYKVELAFNAAQLRLWTTPDRQAAMPLEFTIGQNAIISPFYIEGIAPGQSVIEARLETPGGARVVDTDLIMVSVINHGLVAYRPQTEGQVTSTGPRYGNPFPKMPVPYSLEEDPGAGVRRNNDSDNDGTGSDLDSRDIAAENDLVQVDIVIQPVPLPGIEYVLRRTDDNPDGANIIVWDRPDKKDGSELLEINDSKVLLSTSDPSNIINAWVEWINMDPAGKEAFLTLEVRTKTTDARTDNKTPLADKVRFYPFTSVVLVFGGHDQNPNDTDGDGSIGDIRDANDPATPDDDNREGIFDLAQHFYDSGLDVHAYDEGAEGVDSRQIPYAEVVSAYNKRGVIDVALLGYSQGGGLVYGVAELLHDNGYNVDFALYVDAIENDWFTAEDDDWPGGADYLLNFYEQIDDQFQGDDVDDLSDMPPDAVLDSINVSTDAGWDHSDDHEAIDDDGLVQTRIKIELDNRLNP
ncbi:MAG: hypothetical protein KY475_03020 [Planctomycetes bacterium]|nr:hypothetical protein [Planctomycetota bacterium]